MEPNNQFDELIKEKFSKRELKPSNESWDRLDAMLSVKEEKTTDKKKIGWVYIAASILFFLGLLVWNTIQIKPVDVINTTPSVVNDEVSIPVNKEETKEQLIENEINFESVVFVEKSEVLEKLESDKRSIGAEKEQVIQKKSENKINNENLVLNINEEKIIAYQRIDSSMEPTLQSLLKNAIKDNGLSNKNKKGIRVNASSLLSAAESISEEQETNVEKITRNFNQIKSALANRNFESE